jgi:hypothetical protein
MTESIDNRIYVSVARGVYGTYWTEANHRRRT